MSLLDIFKNKKKNGSASLAKERLQIIIAGDSCSKNFDFIPKLERDIVELVKKYVEISDNDVDIQVQNEDGLEVLELNITLPDQELKISSKK